MIVRSNKPKPMSDEELTLLRIEYEFLLELERILASREEINRAIRTQQGVRYNDAVTDLDALSAQRIFDMQGELSENVSASIKFDNRLLNPNAEEKDIPLRERLIIDAANMQAALIIQKKYDPLIISKMHQSSYHPEQDSGKANIAGVSEFVSNMLQINKQPYSKVSPLRLVTPDSYYLSEDSRKKLKQVKSEYKLKFLLQRLATLDEDYKKLGRSKHSAAISALLRAANNIAESANSDKSKMESIVALIEAEFSKQLSNYTSGFNFFRGNKKAEEFINLLNKNTNDYQFPRLLAVILQNTYRDDNTIGNFGLKHLLNGFDNKKSQHRSVYNAKQADVTNDYIYPTFVANLKNVGLNHTEINKLYNSPITIDKALIIKLWPELIDYGFNDARLDNLITKQSATLNGMIRDISSELNQDMLKKRREAASMHATLDEVLGESKPISSQERKQLHDNIAHQHTPEGVELRIRDIKLALELIKDRQKVLAAAPHPQVQPRI